MSSKQTSDRETCSEMTFAALLDGACRQPQPPDAAGRRHDILLLLAHVSGRSLAWLHAHLEDPVSDDIAAVFETSLVRYRAGEPLAYIIGRRGFWQREFSVNRYTLIPRPETELMVETLLARFDHAPRQVLELGTGTGAIAISLAEERPEWRITATDISADALAVAMENAGGTANLTLLQSDWYREISGCYDLIISNPPYLRSGDVHFARLTFEPRLALDAGEDGLASIRGVVSGAGRHLAENGLLLIEHGYDQQAAVARLLSAHGFCSTETLYDLQGHPRVAVAGRDTS